jgi:hypothetical protein
MRARLDEWIAHNQPFGWLLLAAFVVALVPTVVPPLVLGEDWKGVPVSYTDSSMYKARVLHVAQGHLASGNPYYFEHRDEPSLVIFAGDYLHAIPHALGFPRTETFFASLLLFSGLFLLAFYVLFRRLGVGGALSAAGAFLLYLHFFSHIDRPSNMQPFLPLLALFYIGLLGLIRIGNTKSILLVGLTTGAMFYFYSYLWQSFIITLGIAFLYWMLARQWKRARSVFASGLLAVAIGLPSVVYVFWLAHISPYFWESLGRFGLVKTHLPMMEVVYTGGWVGLALLFLCVLYVRVRTLREDSEFIHLAWFFWFSGLGLWIMQGSNLITGTLLENGEHMKHFIIGWLVFFVLALGTYLVRARTRLGKVVRVLCALALALLATAALHFVYESYVPTYATASFSEFARTQWRDAQDYHALLAWVDAHEAEPVVLWEDPNDQMTWETPVMSRNYVLLSVPGMWHLLPDGEIEERYLVTSFFRNLTLEDLINERSNYMGRNRAYHIAKTEERAVKLCRILHVYDRTYECGAVPTPVDTIGRDHFEGLLQKFRDDVKPNIHEYLAKYHVRYIVNDTRRNQYRPEELGAALVSTEGNYELWRLP